MRQKTYMDRAYKRWCESAFPDDRSTDYPLRGRMYEVWAAAWAAASEHVKAGKAQGESK